MKKSINYTGQMVWNILLKSAKEKQIFLGRLKAIFNCTVEGKSL